jgi:hypothetical protein
MYTQRTAEDADKWQRYIAYSRGVFDGAGRKPMRPEYGPPDDIGPPSAVKEAYARGYADGQRMTREVISAYAAEIGYTPTILRAQEALTADVIGPPSDMAAADGPRRSCGRPSRTESGWCGMSRCGEDP